ncbi:hypothetical protein LOS78_05550 [Paracoccus sp. MA]|uniref:hypothetical protein n=1 Tax=Paracoccus sp. MA TaxID=2895796 RepID=UPI001E3EF1B2|nr:hypothetical protein [Paracoccus sp. MA]UFM63629.1 hypothetical protein LOS78_05550 [Paracoccus sp. MA]
MIMLEFVNSDATPKKVTIHCDPISVPKIMAWYGAYHAGDRYAVYADGVKLAKDQDGELIGDIPQPPENAR